MLFLTSFHKGKACVVLVVFTSAMHLFFQGSLFLHSVLCSLNTLQWRTRSCPGSQSNTFVRSEMPTKWYYRNSCKYCPANILLWGRWSHCWFYCSYFVALGLVIMWTGWKLRHCDLRGQYAWNPWKVKSSVYVVLPISEGGRFPMLSLPICESRWYNFFPLSGLLFLLFPAHLPAFVRGCCSQCSLNLLYTISAVLQFKTAFSLEQS